jgi:hypothetical protein
MLYTMSYDLWISCFCFQTCRMCMKDELVDLSALGWYVLLYYEHINLLCTICGHGACIIHLCTYCDILCMYLWSIMHKFMIYCVFIVVWCKYVVVMPLMLALMHIYWYSIWCAGILVNSIEKEKMGPLPCASTRQRNQISSVVCFPTTKETRIASLCSWEAACQTGRLLCHGAKLRAHDKEVLHDTLSRGACCKHQAHDKVRLTAKHSRMAKSGSQQTTD